MSHCTAWCEIIATSMCSQSVGDVFFISSSVQMHFAAGITTIFLIFHVVVVASSFLLSSFPQSRLFSISLPHGVSHLPNEESNRVGLNLWTAFAVSLQGAFHLPRLAHGLY